MKRLRKPLVHGKAGTRLRFFAISVVATLSLLALVLTAVFRTQTLLYSQTAEKQVTIMPFPVGVDLNDEQIVEQANVSGFFSTQFAEAPEPEPANQTFSWLTRQWNKLAQNPLLQQMASPVSRIVVIWAGDRKEQVVDNFGDILGWSVAERSRFEANVVETYGLEEGGFFPGKYIVSIDTSPEEMASLVNERFRHEVLARYPARVEEAVPLAKTLIVASLIQREGRGLSDMRIISGVIWRRLFANMNLQLDATLQYVKGSEPYGPWWPTVRPGDKYLTSPYNTYQNAGLPPGPIGNPSPAAILAALNPRASDCLFYFHDDDGVLHCSVTYEEHVMKLREIYGRGK